MFFSSQAICEINGFASYPLSVLQDAKSHESDEGYEEGQEGRGTSAGNESHEGYEVKCLVQEMIREVAVEANEGR